MLDSFSTTFRVRGYELGPDGRAGHAAFLRWFEEAAIQASTAAGYDLSKYHELHAAWVMYELDVEFLDAPAYGQELSVKTWISDFRRIRSHREYEARSVESGALLARARVEWIFLDTLTMMPRRLSPEMVSSFTTNNNPALAAIEWPNWTEADALGHWEATRQVQHDEIDQMQHVNNVVYLNWIEQQARDAYRAWGRDLASLRIQRHQIQYRQAAQDGDLLHLMTTAAQTGGSVAWHHQIMRGDTLLVEARSIG